MVAVARLLLALIVTTYVVTAAYAQPVRTSFVHLGPGVPGVLYEPAAPGPKARIAVFIMHSAADYLSFPGCTQLAQRGYRALCANNSTSKSGVSNDGVLDKVLVEAGLGVAHLRRLPGVRKVVLLGHSGGGTVMSAYQLIAENGTAACRGPEKIWRCPDALAGLPRADGLMLIDSNWGLGAMTLLSIDPAVRDEQSGLVLDRALDMFNPANGFVATGSRFPPAFVSAFLTAEGRRNNAILARAQARHAALAAGRGMFSHDEPFVVPGALLFGNNNKLFSQDVRLLSRTRRPWPLIRRDGVATTQIVRTVRVAENERSWTTSLLRGALKTTVTNYLNSFAVRTTADFGYDESGIRGVDWTSTYASPPGNVQGIRAPLLTLGMTGHWEMLAAETIHDLAASRDRTLAFIEGAQHDFTTCRKCEATPGQFGDTQKTTYDYIDRWLAAPGRF